MKYQPAEKNSFNAISQVLILLRCFRIDKAW